MLFGAPDLSFTQFMVETLSVVILALVMTRLGLTPSDHRSAYGKRCWTSPSLAPAARLSDCCCRVTQLPFDDTLSEILRGAFA